MKRISIKRPMLWVLGAWGAGMGLAVLGRWWTFALVLVFGIHMRRKLRKSWIGLILFGCLLMAMIRWNLHMNWEDKISRQPVSLPEAECVIESVQDISKERQRWVVSSCSFRGRAVIYGDQKMRAGDRVSMELQLEPIENPGNPGEFDGKLYQRIRGVYYQGNAKNVRRIASGRVFSLSEQRRKIAQRIRGVLEDQEGELLVSILLGEDAYLDETIQEEFRGLGVGHIMAVSGLHTGLMFQLTEKLLGKKMSERRRKFLGIAVVWMYTGLTGGAVSTVRAAVLCTVSGLQKVCMGKADPMNSLAAAAWMILMIQPLYLLDMGFQLSFSCAAALFTLQNVIRRWFWMSKGWRRILAPTLAISLGTVPISLYYFYTWSPYQLLLNLLILPVMGFLCGMGMMVYVLSLISNELAALCAGSLFWILRMIRMTIHAVSGWPGAVWTIGRPEPVWMIAYYSGLGILLWRSNTPKQKTAKGIYVMICVVLIVWFLWPDMGWRCTFLNVGQGDCCVIEIRGKAFLVDAGPSYEKAVKPYLQSRGIRKIDGIWVSHFDWDHVEGLMMLLEDSDFIVENWYLPAGKLHENDRMRQIEEKAKNIYYIKAGDTVRMGEVVFRCVSPDPDYSYADANSASMVLKVGDGRTEILLCGDADQASEIRFAEYAGRCAVVKIGHHGSKTSTSDLLLERVQPVLAVISCDREGIYGHPDGEVVERLERMGIETLVTDDEGAVIIQVRGAGWRCRTGK